MVDVEIGDPAFDRAFLVEAAPAQIARILLDSSVRRLLASHHAVSLTTESPGGRSVVRLSVRTWLSHDALASAIDVLPSFHGKLVLHAGPQISWTAMPPAMQARICGALVKARVRAALLISICAVDRSMVGIPSPGWSP